MEDAVTTTDHAEDCDAKTVPIRQVERELNRQLKCMQGPGVAPVVRAGLSNLVIYCNSSALAEQVGREVPAIVAIHPARVLLLRTSRRAIRPRSRRPSTAASTSWGRACAPSPSKSRCAPRAAPSST